MNKSDSIAIFSAVMLLGLSGATTARADLETAFDDLVDGRSYRDNLRNQVRDTMVNNFLAAEPPALRRAIDEAIGVRTDPESSFGEASDARYIGFEALEALLYGYLSAGNRDLLKGTRVAFPASLGVTEERDDPAGFFVSADDLPEDVIKSVRALSYAELYFREGIKESLAFIQADPGAAIRAVDLTEATGGSALPYFTKWTVYLRNLESSDSDVKFDDEDDQWSMTGAALLGKTIRRYGGTAVTIADKLWRAAYFHPQGENNREALLTEASEHLRCHMHAQFLASLPLAATLNDGLASQPDATGALAPTRNEYQDVGADIVRSNVTAAQILAGRIARGERPKQVDLVPKWDKVTIDTQMGKLTGLKATTENAWGLAETAIKDNNAAILSATQDRLQRRDRYKFRIWQITGIHPDSNPGFEGLNTEDGREAYLEHVRTWVEQKTANFNPSDAWFTPLSGQSDPAGGASVSQISDLGLASLRMMQAFNELKVAQARIDAIPQQIAIEDRRNNTVNEITVTQGRRIAALDIAVGLSKQVSFSFKLGFPPSMTTSYNPSALVEAGQAVVRNLINTNATTGINDANSRAQIENLLVEQGILVEQLPSSIIQAQLAVAEVKRLGAEVEQLVEDYQYHVDGTSNLWYNDPELVFEQAAAEKRYEDLVRTYQGELYILAKMLEKAWVEPFENPVRNLTGAYEQFANDVRFDLFPDAESIFSVGDHESSSDFWAGLKGWNNYIANGRRGSVIGGRSGGLTDAVEISLRQQIFGLADYRYNAETLRFEVDPVLRHENVRRFRAFVLRQVAAANEAGFEIRLNFPINLTQLVESASQPEPLYLFSSLGVANPNVWNRRVVGAGIELIGNNVTQGTIGLGNQVPVSLYLNGTISRESKWLDSIYTSSNRTIRTDLKLFQYDPFELTALGTDGVFAVEDMRATTNATQPSPASAFQMPFIEWPLACDEWVLLIRNGVANFNWENLDDIKLYLLWEAGPPVSLSNNFAWPENL